MPEPRDIDQCHGCGQDVAVYSDRQYTPEGDLMCSACRAIYRQAVRERARARRDAPKAVEKASKPPCDHVWAPHPNALGKTTFKEFCTKCWEER
jgi:hypothetical protein